jgi:cell division protein FtsZ
MERFVTLATEEKKTNAAILKVVGVGGGGCNALEYMIKKGLNGVEYIAVNTDAQALTQNSANTKVQIGVNITKGLGAGADPTIGKKSVEEDREKITKVLDGANMVFIACGMGGGTGTGAAPMIASIAKHMGILTVGIVTKPFKWEGKKRMLNAEKGIEELSQYVDSIIVIPNSRLISLIEKGTAALDAFQKPNDVLYQATRGIADIITFTGVINVDFADVKTVMSNGGTALMGIGIAAGENRAIRAAENAISSPLLEGMSIRGAKRILLNVTSGEDFTLEEIETANDVIFKAAGDDADIIFGWVVNKEMGDNVSYTVIATGFQDVEGLEKPAEINTNPNTPQNQTAAKPVTPKVPEVLTTIPYNEPVTNLEDLTIPTYKREAERQKLSSESTDFIPVGYKVETLISESLNPTIETTHTIDDLDDLDSSAFLRRMTD